jgi:hypothetical protein
LFGAAPAEGLTKDLIARMIAHRMQEQAVGGLDRETSKLLNPEARERVRSALVAPGWRCRRGACRANPVSHVAGLETHSTTSFRRARRSETRLYQMVALTRRASSSDEKSQ